MYKPVTKHLNRWGRLVLALIMGISVAPAAAQVQKSCRIARHRSNIPMHR